MSNHFCQDINIPCEAGILEGRIQYSEDQVNKTGVILCPPHPLLAGNMDNNVIHSLANTLADHFTVLSFNYRNVGKSFKPEGELPLFEYWDRLDQKDDFSCIIQDTIEVLKWSQRFFANFHLVGYSFGSFIGLSSLAETCLSFCAITPPLAEHHFNFSSITCSSLFVFAEEDDLVGKIERKIPANAAIHEVPQTDHFFREREEEVSTTIASFLLGID